MKNRLPSSIQNHFVIVFLVLGVLISNRIYSQEKQFPSAKELLDMPLDSAFPIISQLNKEQSRNLITQIRRESKTTNPDIDRLYFLISHLEEIQAIEREQARLISLLWVHALGLTLFFAFLLYIFVQQRQAIREISMNRK